MRGEIEGRMIGEVWDNLQIYSKKVENRKEALAVKGEGTKIGGVLRPPIYIFYGYECHSGRTRTGRTERP